MPPTEKWVPRDLFVYDTWCQLWRHNDRRQKGFVDDKVILSSPSASAPEVPHKCQESARGEDASTGDSAGVARVG